MRSLNFTVIFAFFLFTGVGNAEEDSTNCEAPIRDGVELYESEQCFLNLLRSRCEGRDECFVRCLTSGEHRWVNEKGETVSIGGGCFHLCDYGGRSGWEAPIGTEDCYIKGP